MVLRHSLLILLCCWQISGEFCPKQCDCDMNNGLNRATCVGQQIINIDVGVPTAVQVYGLSHNLISELDNFCFKERGYISLQMLDLSYNHIFWVGLHAFSGMDRLNHLDLSNNWLRFLPSDLFWDTPELETLDLSSNMFEVIKNEPFLMHSKLKILNLNNCRIKTLSERMFTRLPNLNKLDLSENYMVTLNTDALRPLRKLERLELRNDYWQCKPDFIAVESWIISHGISYEKQCKKILPKMSEKIIAMTTERVDVDVNKVWNITTQNETLPVLDSVTPLTPFQKFDLQFPSFQSFIIGLEIGLGIGVVVTYIWLRSSCKCRRWRCCTRPQSRRERRRAQRGREMRDSLLWTSIINPELETPPLYRRDFLPDRSYPPFPAYGVPRVREVSLPVEAVRSNRSETPPPPYSDYRRNI